MQAMQKLINRKNCSSDSRSLKKGEVFFDLGSSKNQYGKYFYNALKKKPLAVITQKLNTSGNLSSKIYSVSNVKSFYKKSIFQKYKKTPRYKVAVTGTNGKTSIAYFYYKILNLLNYQVGSVGTLGIFENNKKNKNNLTTPSFLDNPS